MQLLGGLLVVTCMSVFLLPKLYYAVIDSGKNRYTLSAPELNREKTGMVGVMLTVEVDQPKRETIVITSDGADDRNWLGADNIEGFLVNEHPELTGKVELIENGIKLTLKPSDQKVKLKIPVAITESTTSNFNIRRGNRSIATEKMTFISLDGTSEEEGQVSFESKIPTSPTSNPDRSEKLNKLTFGQTSSVFARGYFSRGADPAIATIAYPSGSGAFTATASVSNYSELLAAVANTSISRIEFKNDIIADRREPNVLSRDLVIDGKGFLLSVTSLRNNDVFRLANLRSINNVQFMLANMRIDYNGANKGKTVIKVQSNTMAAWQVALEDIQSEGTSQTHGRLVYNPSGGTILTGNINWQAASSKETDYMDNYGGVINSARIQIKKSDEGTEPVINMTARQTLFRAYQNNTQKLTSFIVEAGQVNLQSIGAQAIFMNDDSSNSPVIFHVRGQNTRLNATASGGHYNGPGATISIGGNNISGDAKGKSYTKIEDGAQVIVTSLNNPKDKDHKGSAAFINQVKSGVFYLEGKGSKFTCISNGDSGSGSIEATFRFRLVGNQTFYLKDQAEFKVLKTAGVSASVRFFGPNNRFFISKGAKLLVDSLGENGGRVMDGGAGGGRQGIQYTNDGGGTSVFDLKGKGSDVAVNARYGPALQGESGAFKFFAGDKASISLIGRTTSTDAGALRLSNTQPLDIELKDPYFYEFRNNCSSGRNGKTVGGTWLSGGNNNSQFKAVGTELEVWKRDPKISLDGPSSKSWTGMDYTLTGRNFATIATTTNPNFNRGTYGNASDYAKVSGGSVEAEVESLRQPTNADKRIYGHAVIASTYAAINGTGTTRDAYTNEVWVTLKLYRLKFKVGVSTVQRDPVTSFIDFAKTYDVVTYEKEVPTIGRKNTTTGAGKDLDGVSQFGEAKTYGIFEWDLSKDSRIKEDAFLWAGDYVEVTGVRRGGDRTDKNYNPKYDIVSSEDRYKDKGRYVFNVRPVEVSTDSLTQGHIDPILDLATSKTTISDATKSIRLQATVKNIKKYAALVPLPEGRAPVITGTASDAGIGKISYYPMLAFGEVNRSNSLASDPISVDNKNSQASQLNLYTYLNPEELPPGGNPALFAFSAWGDDISSLGKDIPPTFQVVKNVTTGDDANPVIGYNSSWRGLRLPAEDSKYHDVVFKKASPLEIESYAPTEFAITLAKKGGGNIGALDLSKEQTVVYQMKLTNPNLLKSPNQLFTSYSATFEVTGNAEIFDAYGGITTPSGVSETHTDKRITFTSNSQVALGVGLNIPVVVSGDFTIKAIASGRTPQEKSLAIPRGSWDEKGEVHNFTNDGFTPGLQVPNPQDPNYPEYYRLLAAPEKVVSVATSRTPIGASRKVYLSITGNQLTVYYRQLKQDSDVKVTVDGKVLTSFKVDDSNIEQSKHLNFKINGVRNIVEVAYTQVDGTTKTVTWKNPKISN